MARKSKGKRPGRHTDLRRAARSEPLGATLRKIQQAELRLPELRIADHAAPTRDFARMLADFGVLIREAKNRLDDVPAFVAWWKENRPQSQRVVLNDWDRRVVGLVIDACNDENHADGPELQRTSTKGATHRHEFSTDSGPEPAYPACLRAFGLLKEGHRVAAGLPEN